MANSNPPKKNQAFTFYITLTDATSALGALKANPTIAAGDFTVSTDGGAFANLGTLPTVTPAAGRGVKISMSASEMNGDQVLIIWEDQTSPPEWVAGSVCIETTA